MSYTRTWQRFSSWMLLASLMLGLAQPLGVRAAPQAALAHMEQPAAQPVGNGLVPVVRFDAHHDTLASLKAVADKAPAVTNAAADWGSLQLLRNLNPHAAAGSAAIDTGTAALNQPNAMPTPEFNFEGVDNVNGVYPPDTVGDIGPNHYMQWVNLSYAIWEIDRTADTAVLVVGPANGNTLWSGFGGVCANNNNGDPIVVYDTLANRWLASQFNWDSFNGPFYQCIAISQTADPTGAWHRYAFQISASKLNDYPHFGVWPDAYYMSVNQFEVPNFNWGGQGVVAFERAAMLNGDAAAMVYFDLFSVDSNLGGMLPSDLDGLALPPVGAPNRFMLIDDDAWGYSPDQIQVWDFHVDWTTPANSTFTQNTVLNLTSTYPFDTNLCNYSRSCIPQPDTGQGLDAIGDRLMYRLAYRNAGGHESWVVNHTVDVDGNDHAGVRWYEVQKTGSTIAVYQAGTYAPDSEHRWMASVAQDHVGNMAVGYSVSSDTVYPSIRYAGRLAGDPLGTLAQGETSLIVGSGSQTGSGARWGDYSMMGIDPLDDCTFWFTTEYLQTTGGAPWQTRIGSFRFPNCVLGPQGALTGLVTNITTTAPIANANLQATLSLTQTFGANTNASGVYSLTVSEGVYTATASAYGYTPKTITNVQVISGSVTTQDFALAQLPPAIVNGYVTDASGHVGLPLYAELSITANGFERTLFTDPSTGFYSTTLLLNASYTFDVVAVGGGYQAASVSVTPTSTVYAKNFGLAVDAEACSAAGYGLDPNAFMEDFENGVPPTGWAVQDVEGNGVVWDTATNWGETNYTGGTGEAATVSSDAAGTADYDTILRTVSITVASLPNYTLTYRANHQQFGTEFMDLDVNSGSGWVNVLSWSEDHGSFFAPPGEDVSIDLTAHISGTTNFQLRWHYYNPEADDWDWYTQIDDVGIGIACVPVTGGRIVGYVTDDNTSLPINGATISNATGDYTAFATPDDPAVGNGFYIAFGNDLTTTATANNYGTVSLLINTDVEAVVWEDFALPAGLLSADPDALNVTVELGLSTTVPLTLANEGGLALDFELKEAKGGFTPQALGPGASLRELHGTFSPLRLNAPFSPKREGPGILRPIPRPRPDALPWLDIANFPVNIMDNTAAAIEGLVYSVGGFDGSFVLADGYVYDPDTNTWAPIASMSEAREKPAVAALDGLLYVVGGWNSVGGTAPVLEIYDPGSDTWTTGASIPVGLGGGAAGAALDGYFYVVGGCADSCGFTDVARYNPGTNTWETLADYPEAISWTACEGIDGLLYCAGGTAGSSESASTYAYNPGTNTWTQLANIPQTQWAMGYTASEGKLYISGGVTDNFATVTNAGFVYDPAANTWAALENSNNTLYRGASACGFYRIGGSAGGFNPVNNAEVYPGLNICGVVDVPWLSEAPITGTLASMLSQVVTVTFDASGPDVPQPGRYTAALKGMATTPYNNPIVPVTMTVTPPATWGKVDGDITGLLRCDDPGAALEGATIHIEGNGGYDNATETLANGHYGWWLPAASGPVTLTIAANGYVAQTFTNVTVTAQVTTTTDADLRLDAPCITLSEVDLDHTVNLGNSTEVTLTLDNAGAGVAEFKLTEKDGAFTPILIGPYNPVPRYPVATRSSSNAAQTFSAPAPIGPLSVRSQTLGTGSTSPAPSVWTDAAPIPMGVVRYASAQCAADPEGYYIISGVDENFSTTTNAWHYDASTDTWMALASFPSAQEGPTATCAEGFVYVAGGGGTDQFYIYDIANNTWAAGANLPRGVWGAALGAWDGFIYMAGGDDDFSFGGTSNEVNIYEIASDTWVGTGASLPIATGTAGVAQAGQYLYVVGGWGEDAPSSNVNATQRYDMSSDTWELGPTFTTGRADLALAVTNANLYAIGGDADGGGPFDGSTDVEMLDHTAWPGGTWTDTGDSLPVGVSANNGGFCTSAMAGGEVWTVSGIDTNAFAVVDSNQYRAAEGCFSGGGDMPWLFEDPEQGTVPADDNSAIGITFDTAVANQPGLYNGTLNVKTGDSAVGTIGYPVTMTVPTPAGWGQIHGRVYGLGYCDASPVLLEDATIDISTSTGVTGTLLQGPSDPWAWWAPAGAVTFTASADGYVAQTAVVNITTGQGLNHDVFLRWDHNCGAPTPTSVDLTLYKNGNTWVSDPMVAVSLSLTNNGTQPWAWALSENSTWLSITGALTGTTAADSTLPSAVLVDATNLLVGGTYTVIVYITHDDELALSPMPVFIRVQVVQTNRLYLPLITK